MRSTASLALLLSVLAVAAWSAPRKGSAASRPAKPPAKAPAPETVYVQVTPPREPAAPAAAAPARRPEAAPGSAFGSDMAQAGGMFVGFYNAEVLGTSPFATLYWDLYPRGHAYFFEFTAGGGTAQSGFSRDVLGGEQFDNNWLAALEALVGFTYSGGSRDPGRAGGLHPYFVAGMTALWQGGIPNVGAVVGFGNRMAAPFGKGRWAINYGLRDHIYSQKIRNEPSLTQNFVLLIGTQKYF